MAAIAGGAFADSAAFTACPLHFGSSRRVLVGRIEVGDVCGLSGRM